MVKVKFGKETWEGGESGNVAERGAIRQSVEDVVVVQVL